MGIINDRGESGLRSRRRNVCVRRRVGNRAGNRAGIGSTSVFPP